LVAEQSAEGRDSIFDWRVFADATCAGLSMLIPVPLVDIFFERIFRRRIPGTIGRVREKPIPPEVRAELGRPVEAPSSFLSGCLWLPIKVGKYILTRLWRKIIYIFTVQDAAVALAEYWHRAYLIDHMTRGGHLSPEADTDLAIDVFNRVLQEIDPSPLFTLAQRTVDSATHVFRLLLRARKLGAAEVMRSFDGLLDSQWDMAEARFWETAILYNEMYAAELVAREKAGIESGARN
jgi:hypothetical protein